MPSHTKDKIYTTGFYIISAVTTDISGVTAAHILAPYPPLLPSNLHKGASKSQFKKLHGRAWQLNSYQKRDRKVELVAPGLTRSPSQSLLPVDA